MPKRNKEYLINRNTMIRKLYKKLLETGHKSRYAMFLIQKELRGELSLERIRKIIHSRNIIPYRK